MNIVPLETVSQDSLPVSARTDTGVTDLFSILMASIAAGNGIQQGSYNVTADSGDRSLTGQVRFSTVDRGIHVPGKVSVSGMPVTPLSVTTTKEVIANVGNEDPEGAVLPQKDLSHVDPYLIPHEEVGKLGRWEVKHNFSTSFFVAGEKGMNSNLPEIKAGTQGKAPAVEFTAQPETAEQSSMQPLLPQAVKGVRAGDGTEVKDENLKAGLVVSGNDEGETVKGLDFGDGIVTAVGRESLDPRLLHASAKPLAAVEGQRPQIDPADLMAQVSGRIKADFKSEGGEVRMELHPESLGHLKIEIRVEGGVVRANILSENAMVRDTIDSNLSMLRSSLEEHGLRIDQLSVGVDQRQSGGNFAGRDDFHGWQEPNGRNALYQEKGGTSDERWSSYAHQDEDGLSIFA